MPKPENAAYSAEYKRMRNEAGEILNEKNYKDETLTALSDGYAAVMRNYETVENGMLRAGSRFTLTRGGESVYECVMPFGAGGLICGDIIRHGGGAYLLFRAELYGYSVLNLSTLKAAHYMPLERLDNQENFIWADAVYCQSAGLLFVSGCYWACPYSLIAVDFTAPDERAALRML